MTKLNIINANARSLKPKTSSLIDCMTELDVDFAILTETWLNDNQIGELQQDLSLGSGLGLVALNRKAHDNGVSYGGVAVAVALQRSGRRNHLVVILVQG